MNPKAQRIAIAEACGYIARHREEKHLGSMHKWTEWTLDYAYYGDIPDYLNDLNAMHEAEKILTDEQQRVYLLYLGHIADADRDDCSRYINLWKGTTATAAQRAEAFFRTLNLWKEQ